MSVRMCFLLSRIGNFKKNALYLAYVKKLLYLCSAFLKTEVPTVKTLLLRMTKANAYHFTTMSHIAQNSNVVGVAALKKR